MNDYIKQVNSHNQTQNHDFIAIGTIVDTNDPLQLGRLRICVPSWGDSWDSQVDTMQWAMCMTPFGGTVQNGTRGPALDSSSGNVAYGMIASPCIGAQAIVTSLDKHHTQRIYLGCIYDLHSTHTMPHGRFMYDDHPELKDKPDHAPFGPYTSSESLIQPLADNMKKAFTTTDENGPKVSQEWKTRVGDYSASRVDVSQLHNSTSKVQDDLEHDDNGFSITNGYQNSRIDPHGNPKGKNYDNQVYSITSPGFHSISMDDRMENCRVRIRTTSGSQILLDDTNERIYIMTCQGNNWIELDQNGNIDVYSSNKLSIHAEQGINLVSGGNINMKATGEINMTSGKDIRMTSSANIMLSAASANIFKSIESTFMQSDASVNIKSGTDLKLTSTGSSHIQSQTGVNIQCENDIALKAGGNIIESGIKIHLNGPDAPDAAFAADAKPKPAFMPSRIPLHEPWPRSMTKDDDSIEPEFSYDDPNSNRIERGKPINRGLYWRR